MQENIDHNVLLFQYFIRFLNQTRDHMMHQMNGNQSIDLYSLCYIRAWIWRCMIEKKIPPPPLNHNNNNIQQVNPQDQYQQRLKHIFKHVWKNKWCVWINADCNATLNRISNRKDMDSISYEEQENELNRISLRKLGSIYVEFRQVLMSWFSKIYNILIPIPNYPNEMQLLNRFNHITIDIVNPQMSGIQQQQQQQQHQQQHQQLQQRQQRQQRQQGRNQNYGGSGGGGGGSDDGKYGDGDGSGDNDDSDNMYDEEKSATLKQWYCLCEENKPDGVEWYYAPYNEENQVLINKKYRFYKKGRSAKQREARKKIAINVGGREMDLYFRKQGIGSEEEIQAIQISPAKMRRIVVYATPVAGTVRGMPVKTFGA